MDKSVKIYKDSGFELDYKNVNKVIKAVILNFGNGGSDIVVENDNFGTRRRYPDFTKGKEKAGLHPLQIVFAGWDIESIGDGKYIGADDKVHHFSDYKGV